MRPSISISLVSLLSVGCCAPTFAQRAISLEAAAASIRQFVSDPDLRLVYIDSGHDWPHGVSVPYLNFRSPDRSGSLGDFEVSSSNGRVLWMSLPSMTAETGRIPLQSEVRLSYDQAMRVARDFLSTHAPEILKRNWTLARETHRTTARGVYSLIWYEVIHPSGTLGPWDLWIEVDSQTGKVVLYSSPPDTPIVAPVIPQVSLERARATATQFAIYDPEKAPFTGDLQVVEDPSNGIQRLVWKLHQALPDSPQVEFRVVVNAITGEAVAISAPLGVSVSKQIRQLAKPKSAGVSLRAASDKSQPISASTALRLDRDCVWIRAELVRPFGGEVKITQKGIDIYAGPRTISGKTLGATWHDYGWWIPLRKTADLLGWKLIWTPETHVVSVVTDAPRVGSNR